MRHLWLVLVLALFVCTCSGRAVAPKAAGETLFHVDTGFDAEERDHIRHACTAWNLFSGGRVHLVASFDLDFQDLNSLIRYHDAPLIVAVESGYPSVVAMDLSAVGILGWTDMESRKVFIVMDRIPRGRFYSIVLHEIGHTLGLRHSAGKRDVMSEHASGMESFTAGDLAVCRAAGVCL